MTVLRWRPQSSTSSLSPFNFFLQRTKKLQKRVLWRAVMEKKNVVLCAAVKCCFFVSRTSQKLVVWEIFLQHLTAAHNKFLRKVYAIRIHPVRNGNKCRAFSGKKYLSTSIERFVLMGRSNPKKKSRRSCGTRQASMKRSAQKRRSPDTSPKTFVAVQ